jgi:hypothetical protein
LLVVLVVVVIQLFSLFFLLLPSDLKRAIGKMFSYHIMMAPSKFMNIVELQSHARQYCNARYMTSISDYCLTPDGKPCRLPQIRDHISVRETGW